MDTIAMTPTRLLGLALGGPVNGRYVEPVGSPGARRTRWIAGVRTSCAAVPVVASFGGHKRAVDTLAVDTLAVDTFATDTFATDTFATDTFAPETLPVMGGVSGPPAWRPPV